MAVSLYLPEEGSQVRGAANRKGSHWMGEGPCFCTVLPDPSLCEPGLVGNGWDGGVHQGVGFNERQGFIREIDGGFISFGKPMLCTTARPERNIVCLVPPHNLYLGIKCPSWKTRSREKGEWTKPEERCYFPELWGLSIFRLSESYSLTFCL